MKLKKDKHENFEIIQSGGGVDFLRFSCYNY